MAMVFQIPDELVKEFERLNLEAGCCTCRGSDFGSAVYSGAGDTQVAVRGCWDSENQGENETGRSPRFHRG
jgi:hypothetical protein